MKAGIEGFQSVRLKQLRLALGLTQAALSDMVGRTCGDVAQWESGQQAPQAAAFQRLCDFFGVSKNWLLEARVSSQQDTPFFFRSQGHGAHTARDIARVRLDWLQEISYKLQESLEFTAVNIPHLTETHCELISNQAIEQAASDCRQAWRLGNAPISNVVQVMENAGIVCARTALGHLKMEGVSNWCGLDQRPYVLLIADKANGIRNRFDAAHELGHIVLHRFITKEQCASRHALLESQAHHFARAFLLPAEGFMRDVRWPAIDTLLNLKSRWKVSVSVLITRCEELGVINDVAAARLYKAHSARGWAQGEPLDEDVELERPQLLGRGVEMLVENKILSCEQVRQLLGMPIRVLEALCSLDDGYFERLGERLQVIDIRLRHRALMNNGAGGTAEILRFPIRK
ncbi:ImmA/IrrE family metallo-endopeptidase [Pseudomonas gingeri]|uniref:ImmA/IrrE family metallo-endopeptidase n=1 Tax=Pseudomonas gingeri TaxID=117681 RepID=A0A7Y8C020_9PSED|nr:XRE family transcriptional regulator [Pseudomonas gingeri]NWB94383.1 ImmA/IrrE family metallo-endopeptidase [Pseudomonas gingeri]